MNPIRKRDLLVAGLGAMTAAGAARAQAQNAPMPPAATNEHEAKKIPNRMVKTTPLFKGPGNYCNAMAVSPEGLWLGQQKITGDAARRYHLPDQADKREAAWLVDWNGKLLKTVLTNSRNTSGMAYGDGCVWMMANELPQGCFQVDMNGKEISHRQVPLHMPDKDGGGCHGAQWHDGKLWIVANRPKLLLRVDPKSWIPEVAIPIYAPTDKPRWHDMTIDGDGNLWQVTGNDSTRYNRGTPGLVKYDGISGEVLMTCDFAPGSCDPHGLEWHDGALVSCDAGIHPGWPNGDSPHAGYIFRIELA